MGSKRKLLRTIPKVGDQGFVLITSLMVIFLVVTIVTTVALVTASDLRAAAKARAVIETRLMAESVSDAVFASIATEKFSLYDTAVEKFRTDPGNSGVDPDTNPLASVVAGDFGGWFVLNDDGTLDRCQTIDQVRGVCFRARLTPDTTFAERSQQITLDIVARGGCIVQDPDAPTGCVFREFQQVFRTRAYIENVTLTEFETPDVSVPALATAPTDSGGNPYKVAYIGSDILKGKIRTNDNRFLRCGTIVSDPDLNFSSDSAASEELPSASNDCNGSELPNLVADTFDKFLPAQIDKSGNASVVQANNVFSALAGGAPSASNYYSLQGPATIRLNNGNIDVSSALVNATGIPYPSNGVIFVNGTLTIEDSTYSRSLSIVATDDITINGDLTIIKPGPIELNGSTPALSPTETDPILGVSSASGDISLKCRTGTAACDNRYIVGVLSAREGTIYNPNWNDLTTLIPNPNVPPRLYVYGSLIAKHRPIFGAYTSVSSSKATYGWAKSINFDIRFRDFQPPYFFRTTQASVVRSSMEVSRCTESFC